MWTYNCSNELYHFGILGMKWGKRRYQNKDGTLTNAGEKRYKTDVDGAYKKLEVAKSNEKQALKNYNRVTGYGTITNKEALKNLNDSINKTKWAKQDVKTEKTKEKMNEETKPKSDHRLKLEKHYLDKGMSQEEAEVAAYKRAKTEKIIAITAGVTVTAAAAYVAYKYHEKTVDKVLKSGTLLQNISTNSNKGVEDAFYASMTNTDNNKYRGLYGDTLGKTGKAVYETKIAINKDFKLASEKSAVKALSELVTDDKNYANTLKEHLTNAQDRYPSKIQNDVVKKGLESINKGKIDAKVYDALNISLTDHSLETSSTVNKGLYDKLKSKGYDAIVDVNDKKYSGYRSANPIIAFSGDSKMTVSSIRELGSDEIGKSKVKGMMDLYVKSIIPQAALITAGTGLTKAAQNASETMINDKIVQAYRKKHPDTKLTYNEIVRNNK